MFYSLNYCQDVVKIKKAVINKPFRIDVLMSKVTEHIRCCDRTKKLVGIMFVPGYFIFIVTKVNGWR